MLSPLEWVGAALLGAMVCWWVIAVVMLPARELRAVLRRIAAGDFRPVILSGVPMLYRRTCEDLRRTAETLARQKALLEEEEFSIMAILGSMAEGVVITGADLRIRQVNTAAAQMFNLKGSIAGLLLPEAFLSHELQGVARRAAETGDQCRLLPHRAGFLEPPCQRPAPRYPGRWKGRGGDNHGGACGCRNRGELP